MSISRNSVRLKSLEEYFADLQQVSNSTLEVCGGSRSPDAPHVAVQETMIYISMNVPNHPIFIFYLNSLPDSA